MNLYSFHFFGNVLQFDSNCTIICLLTTFRSIYKNMNIGQEMKLIKKQLI